MPLGPLHVTELPPSPAPDHSLFLPLLRRGKVQTHICRWAKPSKAQENFFCCSQKEQRGSCSISWPMLTVHPCHWHPLHKLPSCSPSPKQSWAQECPRIQLLIQIKPYFQQGISQAIWTLCVRWATPRVCRAVCTRERFGFSTNTFTFQQNTQIIYPVIFHRKKQISRMSVHRMSSSGPAVHSREMTDHKISSAV